MIALLPLLAIAADLTNGTAADVKIDIAVIIETSETDLSIQEAYTLIAPSDKQIPASELKIRMPPGARLLQVDEKAKGFKANLGEVAIEATEPLIGTKQVSGAYLFPKSGGSLFMNRSLPFAVQSGRVILQDLSGLEVNLNVQAQRRTRDLNGQNFIIYDFASLARGTDLKITVTGFPSQAIWPRRLATLVVFGILFWMGWAVMTKRVPGRTTAAATSPVSARARRDQIVKAIEVLERDFATETVKPKKYERRHAELMKELAEVLHELELSTTNRIEA